MGAKVKAEATEPNVLGFVPAEEAHFANAELAKDLGAHAEIPVAHGLRCNRAFIRHAGGMSVPAQIHQGPSALLREHRHGLLEETGLEAMQVIGEGFHVHPDQGRLAARSQIAEYESQVAATVQQALKPVHLEFAPDAGHGADFQGLHQGFLAEAVGHEIRHSHQRQAVLAAERHEIRHSGHGAVIFHDLADDTAGVEARQARQVHAGLGLARAGKHPSGPGPQGEDVAWLHEVLGLGVRSDERLDGP